MTENLPTLAQVVGQNCRKLRGSLPRETLLGPGRELGIFSSAGTIANLENGSAKITIELLIGLSISLGKVRGERKPIAVSRLVEHDSPIQIGSHLKITDREILTWLRGGSIQFDGTKFEEAIGWGTFGRAPGSLSNEDLSEIIVGVSPTEERLAKKIEVEPAMLRLWSFHLWGHSLADERDSIAGSDASPQKKGRITRQLLQEIVSHMDNAEHGNNR